MASRAGGLCEGDALTRCCRERRRPHSSCYSELEGACPAANTQVLGAPLTLGTLCAGHSPWSRDCSLISLPFTGTRCTAVAAVSFRLETCAGLFREVTQCHKPHLNSGGNNVKMKLLNPQNERVLVSVFYYLKKQLKLKLSVKKLVR